MDNKTLVARVATKLGKSKTDVSRLIEALAGAVAARCAEMNTVALPGFGNFVPRKHDEEIRNNPDTGRRTLYPPRVELTFQPSNILKNKLK
ncbi:MAG: HU family DNA-binding protein [Muribaculaceae bacterium]|nr:HU family DNA-binding protein [Muribaculaceae bacterium]